MNLNISQLLLFALVISLFSCNPSRNATDTWTAYEPIFDYDLVNNLKGNDLYVQLIEHDKEIQIYKNHNQNTRAKWVIDEDKKHNDAIRENFKKHFNFANVYFYKGDIKFWTKTIEVEDSNGKLIEKAIDLEEQIYLGSFIFTANRSPRRTMETPGSGNNLSFLIERWPDYEDTTKGKNNLLVTSFSPLSKSQIKILVKQIQERLTLRMQGR